MHIVYALSCYHFLLSLIFTIYEYGMSSSINRYKKALFPNNNDINKAQQMPSPALQQLIGSISSASGRRLLQKCANLITQAAYLSVNLLLIFLFLGTAWSSRPAGSPRCQRFPGGYLVGSFNVCRVLSGHCFLQTSGRTSDGKKRLSARQSQFDTVINAAQ